MYKSPNENTLNILHNHCLWASKPEHFNDPFDDGNLKIAKDVTEQDYLEATCRKYGKSDQWPSDVVQYVSENLDADGNFTSIGRDRVNKAIQELIEKNRNSGVVCLSEVCDSILMWSHYAQKHMGICFEFIRAEDNALGDEEKCSPVRYDRHYPQIDLGRMFINQDGETIRLMMKTKSWEWAYEKEWRLITDYGDNEYPLPGPISRVILGIRIENNFKSCIEKLCKDRGIPCVQARKADREFRIEVPLDRKRRWSMNPCLLLRKALEKLLS